VLGCTDQRAKMRPEVLVGVELDDLGQASSHVRLCAKALTVQRFLKRF
jgi:hypothetical protein